MKKYHIFISYASEDKQFASELAGGFMSHGVKIWYDKKDLEVGDKLLDGINLGLRNSKYGLLLISTDYLKKGWTNHEMDVLIRQHIEKKKRLFPIWLGVTKKEVEQRNLALGGIVSLDSNEGIEVIISKIIRRVYKDVSTVAIISEYTKPLYRFLTGYDELKLAENGATFTIWTALLYFKDSDYPLGVEGRVFTKQDLLWHASDIFLDGGGYHAGQWVSEDGIKRIKKMCKDAGYLD